MTTIPSQQDLSLAKRLAHSSDKHIRAATAKTLATWLRERKSPSEEDYLKLWKAIFYTVWHSDKVPVQQELALNVARLVRAVAPDEDRTFLFLSTFFTTMRREWGGIDKHRMDKYLTLLRRVLEEALRFCLPSAFDSAGGSRARAARLGALLQDAVTTRRPNGIRFHFCEIFLDEICATAPDVATPELLLVLEPFLSQASMTDDPAFFERVTKDILGELLARVEAAQAPGADAGDGGEAAEEAGADVEADDDASSSDADTGAAEASSAQRGGDGWSSHAASDLTVDVALLRAHQAQRQRNSAVALRRVRLAPLALRIFSIACDKATKPTHRTELYALHGRYAAAARSLGHATTDAQLYPREALAPPGTASVEPPVAAASTTAGAKRKRGDASVVVRSDAAAVFPAATSKPATRQLAVPQSAPALLDRDEEDEVVRQKPLQASAAAARTKPQSSRVIAKDARPPDVTSKAARVAAKPVVAAPLLVASAPMALALLAIPSVAALQQQQLDQALVNAAPAGRRLKSAAAAAAPAGRRLKQR